jgi:hypothetical protein
MLINAFGNINWLAVVLATVACTALGGVWFAGLFNKQYARALGRDPAQKLETTALFYIGPMVSTLVVVVTSAILLRALNITEFKDALALGALVGIGYLVTTMFTVAINPNFPKPLSYAVINAPYLLLSSMIIVSILMAFKK